MRVASLIPLGPWAGVLQDVRRADGPVALEEGPPGAPDAWTLAKAVAACVPEVTVVVVVDPDRRPPGLLAMMVATLDALSGGRIVVALRSSARVDGAARRDEAWWIVDRLLRGETVDHAGRYFRVPGAVIGLRPVQTPRPPLLRDTAVEGEFREEPEVWLIRPSEASK